MKIRSKIRKPESIFFLYGKIGDVFYSSKEDKYLTAAAIYFHRKIKTERFFAFNKKSPKSTTFLTKVTLTNNINSKEDKK